MKKIIFFLLLLFCFAARSQPNQINIVNFTVKNTLPANIESWNSTPGALLLTAQKGPQSRDLKPFMVLQIRSGGSIICGNNASTAKQIDPFDVRTFTTSELLSYLTGCKELKEGTYSLCVQFFNAEHKEISREVCKEFKVESLTTNYSPPQNIAPADKKQFTEKEISAPVTFRWTPIVPKPKESVTYRIKVWQLMQGQNGTTAMRVNQPIVTKDVDNLTQTTISNLYTGPCKPPYLCDFVWTVQALNREGKPIGNNNGTSEPTAFAVTQYIIQLDSIKVSCTNKPGVYAFSYTITNPNPGPATLNLFTVTSSVPGGASIASFSPPINTVINAGSQLTITGTINAATNLSNICIGAEIKDVGNAFWKASKDTCVKVDACRCDACDEKNFVFTSPKPAAVNYINNTLSYNQNITVTTTPAKTIKSITAELVYFELVPENNLCIPCNKDASTYGHFTNGSNSLQWNGPQTSLNINITTPQLVPCCSALFRWCIRYKIEFTDCTSCNKLVCYEKKKEGCDKIPADNNNKDPK
ncbi:MAG: hypothetical protein KA160_03840 [Lacibacter sp.]|nr:hypothetical protein [Lacibacter sp.]